MLKDNIGQPHFGLKARLSKSKARATNSQDFLGYVVRWSAELDEEEHKTNGLRTGERTEGGETSSILKMAWPNHQSTATTQLHPAAILQCQK